MKQPDSPSSRSETSSGSTSSDEASNEEGIDKAISAYERAVGFKEKTSNFLSDSLQTQNYLFATALNALASYPQNDFKIAALTSFCYYYLGQLENFIAHVNTHIKHKLTTPQELPKIFKIQILKAQNGILDSILNHEPTNYAQLLNNLTAFVAIYPEDPRPYTHLVDLCTKYKDLDNAIKYIQKAISISPENPTYCFTAAKLFHKTKDYVQASIYIQAAIAKEPKSSQFHNCFSIISLDKYLLTKDPNDLDCSVKHARLAFAYNQNEPKVQEQLTRALSHKTKAELDNILVLPDIKDPLHASYDLAHTLSTKSLYHDAIAVAKSVTERDKEYAAAYHLIGYCYSKLDQLELAFTNYKTAFELEPCKQKYVKDLRRFENIEGFGYRVKIAAYNPDLNTNKSPFSFSRVVTEPTQPPQHKRSASL